MTFEHKMPPVHQLLTLFGLALWLAFCGCAAIYQPIGYDSPACVVTERGGTFQVRAKSDLLDEIRIVIDGKVIEAYPLGKTYRLYRAEIPSGTKRVVCYQPYSSMVDVKDLGMVNASTGAWEDCLEQGRGGCAR